MIKLRVSEMAKQRGVSVQTIYKQIKRGSLNTVKEDGITYVLTDNVEVKEEVKESVTSGCEDLLTMVKSLSKQVKSLNKQLVKCHESKQDVLMQYIGELKQLKQLNLPSTTSDDDAIDLVPVKKKRKKKKKKK